MLPILRLKVHLMFNKKDPKKYILASGCSFTDANWRSRDYPDYDCSFPRWPALLGDKLGVDNVVNLGKSGYCNELIINGVIDHILHEEKPWLVVIGLSEATRFAPYNGYVINPHVLGRDSVKKMADPETVHFDFDEWYEVFRPAGEWLISRDQKNGHDIMVDILSNYIRQVNRIVSFCHRLNIKVIIGSLLWPVVISDYGVWRDFHKLPKKHQWTFNALAKMFMDCKGFDDVDPKAFVGWPIWPELGGNMICARMDREPIVEANEFTPNMRLGPLDGHPNILGHHHIAEKFYEHYKKTY